MVCSIYVVERYEWFGTRDRVEMCIKLPFNIEIYIFLI